MNTLVCSANSFTVYCTLFVFSYSPIVANESLSHKLTSTLKKNNIYIYTVGTESIQTPLNFSLFVILQPFAKII